MNLYCCIPIEHDATSFYRALQPLAQLRRIIPGLQLHHSQKEITMTHIAAMDVAFIQRPYGPDHLQLIDFCRSMGVKVWLDYDDNLFCVPQSNPAHNLFGSDQTKKTLKAILNKADVISVSTRKLGLDLAKHIDKEVRIHIIPNAFNDYLFKEKPVFKPHNIILWRGTQSHQNDLHLFGPHIIKASKSNPNWLFNFMGYNPFFLTEPLGKQAVHTQPMEILKYHEVLRETYPNLCMVTLSDNDFNRCKSNIAWIEATYAGAVTIAPLWEEWTKPGIYNYSDPKDFEKTLNSALTSHSYELKDAHARSWEYIQDSLVLSKINKLRANLLEEVLS